jgi:hypothetical protein
MAKPEQCMGMSKNIRTCWVLLFRKPAQSEYKVCSSFYDISLFIEGFWVFQIPASGPKSIFAHSQSLPFV